MTHVRSINRVIPSFIQIDSFKTGPYYCSFSSLTVPALWVSGSGASGIDCCDIAKLITSNQETQMRIKQTREGDDQIEEPVSKLQGRV